jgi:hypothetical protein
MKSSQKLVLELQKLNKKLDSVSNHSRFMVYSANPFKFALFNFIAGIFHSLGSLFGTVIIAAVFVYFFSQFDVTRIFSEMLQDSINQVRWEQITPSPQP